MDTHGSREVARCAVQMSLTKNREEEKLKKRTAQNRYPYSSGRLWWQFISSINKIIERTVVAAKRSYKRHPC